VSTKFLKLLTFTAVCLAAVTACSRHHGDGAKLSELHQSVGSAFGKPDTAGLDAAGRSFDVALIDSWVGDCMDFDTRHEKRPFLSAYGVRSRSLPEMRKCVRAFLFEFLSERREVGEKTSRSETYGVGISKLHELARRRAKCSGGK
jgi:hypothetical protein